MNGLLTHSDSPYIRALGFMYLRYTQPPSDLYDWYEEYLQDEEEIDVKAGGGQVRCKSNHKPNHPRQRTENEPLSLPQTITIGQMLYQFLTKLDWFSTLFPRIPVPIQKQIQSKLAEYCRDYNVSFVAVNVPVAAAPAPETSRGVRGFKERERDDNDVERERNRERAAFRGNERRQKSRSPEYRNRSRQEFGERRRRSRSAERSKERDYARRSSERTDRHRHKDQKSRNSDKSDRERDRERDYTRDKDRERDHERERDRRYR